MKKIFLIVLPVFLFTKSVSAQEIGHFAPGVFGIRDFNMPDSGFYGAIYSYKYSTERLNDGDGNEISSAGPNGQLGLDVDVNVGVISPTFIWVTNWKLLGANCGIFFSPAFGNTSVGASLAIESGLGRDVDEKQFGLADMYVQPIWLTWKRKQFDFSVAFGLYIPTGKYETETIVVPLVDDITVESADNIGYGYLTQQYQGAASWYPWVDKRMAIAGAMTLEVNSKKKDYDLRPGQNLSFNLGVSQYLPLNKEQKLLLEIGPAGYHSRQITDDKGDDAAADPVRDEASAIGGQIGLTNVNWNAVLNFHYFYEFSTKDRFQGESIGLNLALKF